jgi:hypothetical protein
MDTGGPFTKRGRGVTLTTHPIYCRGQEWVGAIHPLPPSAFVSCSGTALLFALRLLMIHAYIVLACSVPLNTTFVIS